MEDQSAEVIVTHDIEILPPEREGCLGDGILCLCCGRPQSTMDEDGCGICEECLAPSFGGDFSNRRPFLLDVIDRRYGDHLPRPRPGSWTRRRRAEP